MAPLIVWIALAAPAWAGNAPGLVEETMLHPLDSFTAYTLKKNEFIYNQSPLSLPFPSWAWWGVTDWLTAEIDFPPLIGGLFIDPHLPVPSFNFRFRLKRAAGWSPALAYETMTQYLYEELRQIKLPNLEIRRQGLSWFNRVNASFECTGRLRLHLSAGGTYSHDIDISNVGREAPRGRTSMDRVHPDFSIGIDHRTRPWISLHGTASYGTTFVYFDNIPRKRQLTYGFRLAPFLNSRRPFLRALRAEFLSIYADFPDAQEHSALLLPLLPYFYWGWRW